MYKQIKFLRTGIFLLGFSLVTNQALAISLLAEFLDTRATTIGGMPAEDKLDDAGLSDKKNPATTVVNFLSNKEGQPKDLPGEPLGATQVITGTPSPNSVTNDPTTITFRPMDFDLNSCDTCTIGQFDIFNGRNLVDTTAKSLIIEFSLPDGATSSNLPAKFWFFLDNTLNDPGLEPDIFTLARASNPNNETKIFSVFEDMGKEMLPLQVSLTGREAIPQTIVPEPSAILLIGTGLLGLLLRYRLDPKRVMRTSVLNI